jgi:hypothetical protein
MAAIDSRQLGFVMLPEEPPDQNYVAQQVAQDGNSYKTWYPCDEGWVDTPPEDLEPDDFGDAISWGTLVGRTMVQNLRLLIAAWQPSVTATQTDTET